MDSVKIKVLGSTGSFQYEGELFSSGIIKHGEDYSHIIAEVSLGRRVLELPKEERPKLVEEVAFAEPSEPRSEPKRGRKKKDN